MDEHVELLRGIWTEMKALNGRVTTTNEQLGEVRAGLRSGLAEVRAGLDEVRGSIEVLGERIDLVHTRSVERDLRIATALTEVAGEVHELRLDVRDLKGVVFEWHDEHRADRANLEERVGLTPTVHPGRKKV